MQQKKVKNDRWLVILKFKLGITAADHRSSLFIPHNRFLAT